MTEPVQLSDSVQAIRQDTIEDLMARILDNRSRQEALEAEHKHLRAVLLTLLPKGRTTVGDSAVTVTSYRKFSAKLAQKMLTPEQYESICVPVPDAKRAKAILSPEDYEAACGAPQHSLTIR